MENRLSRTTLLLGEKHMRVLAHSHVMVVGCGAVGSYAIEALARGGVGKLTLVDFDKVSVSNINRQLIATQSTLGRDKTTVAAERIADICPDIVVRQKRVLVNENTIESLFDEKTDFVVDAIDSLNPKATLIQYLQEHHIPFISSMGAALRTDVSKVETTRCKKTKNCPLAFFIRKRLRKRGVSLDFPVVYSSELPDKAHLAEGIDEHQQGGRIRHQMGSLPTLTGIFGLMCANYVLLNLPTVMQHD